MAWNHTIVGQSILDGHALRGGDGQGRDRRDLRRGRGRHAVRDPQPRRRPPQPHAAACRCSGGARSATRTRPSSWRASSTSWPTRPARTRSSTGRRSSRASRATWACSSWPRRRRAGAKPLPPGRARGIAVHAVVRQLRRPGGRGFGRRTARSQVHRVVCAIDCGHRRQPGHHRGPDGGRHRLRPDRRPARPDHVEGRTRRAVATSTTTRVLRLDEMPEVEVHIVPSTEPPRGRASPACLRSRRPSPTRCSR